MSWSRTVITKELPNFRFWKTAENLKIIFHSFIFQRNFLFSNNFHLYLKTSYLYTMGHDHIQLPPNPTSQGPLFFLILIQYSKMLATSRKQGETRKGIKTAKGEINAFLVADNVIKCTRDTITIPETGRSYKYFQPFYTLLT